MGSVLAIFTINEAHSHRVLFVSGIRRFQWDSTGACALLEISDPCHSLPTTVRISEVLALSRATESNAIHGRRNEIGKGAKRIRIHGMTE
jgi:hypothetical protein